MVTRGLGPRRSQIVVSALTATVVGAGCLAATVASPAAAAPDPCVTAFPQADLVPGQSVTGLTVSTGTEPEPFEGTVAGVLDDGIAPGVDMILADLSSTAIDANGIWAGMSGSPVYADPERTQLIGAVSYTLNEGKTTLAGITPAADMLGLRPGAVATRAELGATLTRRLATTGVATRTQLGSGLRQLPTPIAVSGLSAKRFGQLAGWLDDHGPVTNAGGRASASAAADASDIVPGGNVAASLGWGFVSAAATGTVTDVCGDDVLAFGHPFDYAGDTTYSMHPAEAVAVVPGGTFAGFKLANLGEPVGTFSSDRIAGIRGTVGPAPTAYDVTSRAIYRDNDVTGTTKVTVQDLVADAGLANAFAVSDRALDRTGKGSASASWTITGERRNGTPFTLRDSDVFPSTYDVASAPVTELTKQLYTLLENETEAVTITGITTTTRLDDDATFRRIGRTYWRSGGTWKRITGRSPAVIKAGTTANIRVELYSPDSESVYIHVPVRAARASVGRVGRLTLSGGYAGEDDFFFFDSDELFFDEYEDEILGGEIPDTIPQVLARLRAERKNTALAHAFSVRGTTTVKRTRTLGKAVSGYAVVPVVVRR